MSNEENALDIILNCLEESVFVASYGAVALATRITHCLAEVQLIAEEVTEA